MGITEDLFFPADRTNAFPSFLDSRRDVEWRIARDPVSAVLNRLVLRFRPSMGLTALFHCRNGGFATRYLPL